MSTGAVKAGEAFVRIFSQDDTGKGFGSAMKSLKSFGMQVGAVGASLSGAATAGLAGLGAAVKSFADFGGGIMDSMVKTSMGSDMLQTLSFMAGQAGGSIKDVEVAAKKMNQTIGQAANGNKSAAKALGDLGLSAEGLMQLSPDEQFAAIVDALSKISDPAARAAASMKVFGRSSAQLNEIIGGGAGGIAAAMKDLQGSGLILNPEDIANADNLGDSWGKLTATLERAWQLVGAALAPAVTTLIEEMQGWATWVSRAVNNNRDLIVMLGKALVVIGAVGGVLMMVGGAMIAIPAIIGAVSAGFALLASIVGAILSPVGLIVAGIALLIAGLAALVYWLDQTVLGGAGLTLLVDGFWELWDVATKTIGGIVNALSSGKWMLAASIAMAGLQVAFETGWGWLRIGIQDFTSWAINKLVDIFGSEMIAKVLGGIKNLIDKINDAIQMVNDAGEWAGLDLGLGKIGTGGLQTLIDKAKEGDQALKDVGAAAAAGVRADVDANIAKAKAALAELNKLTEKKETADDKRIEKISGNLGGAGGKATAPAAMADILRADMRAISQGAFLGSSAMMLGRNSPEVGLMQEAQKQTALLETIADNTEDAGEGEEFGD